AIGCFFLIRRHEIDYLRPGEGGEAIKIVTWVDEFRPASALRVARILRAKDDTELVVARTEWVFVTIDKNRPKRIPIEVVRAFQGPPVAGVAA
ncbi:MAG TPA: thioesterase family protein, partial [Myxococcota bacterium]